MSTHSYDMACDFDDFFYGRILLHTIKKETALHLT